jgi:hypothetical protein
MYQTLSPEDASVVTRKWLTIDDGKHTAKDRLNVFKSVIDPNWDYVFKALKQK